MGKGTAYVEKGVSHYDEQLMNQKKKLLNRLATEMNVELIHKCQTGCHW